MSKQRILDDWDINNAPTIEERCAICGLWCDVVRGANCAHCGAQICGGCASDFGGEDVYCDDCAE